jgi:hypothetical protein
MDLVCIWNSSVNGESVLLLENFFVNQNFIHIDSYADVEFPKKPSFQLWSKFCIHKILTPHQSLSLVEWGILFKLGNFFVSGSGIGNLFYFGKSYWVVKKHTSVKEHPSVKKTEE